MSNIVLGANIYYFDTNGVVNKGNPCYVSKVAIWGIDTTSYISLAADTGNLPFIKLSFNSAISIPWQESTFHPPHFFTSLSVLNVINGSGYVYVE